MKVGCYIKDTNSEEAEFVIYVATPIKDRPIKKALSISMIPTLNIQVQVLVEKYIAPIKVIAYVDTGAHKTMINPYILPKQF